MTVYIKLLAMVILTSFSQIFIKIGSRKIITNSGLVFLIKSFFNYYIIIGITLVIFAPILYFSALSSIPLNIAFSINGLAYILVIILGRLILNEYITLYHIIGGVLIFAGFLIWNMGAVSL